MYLLMGPNFLPDVSLQSRVGFSKSSLEFSVKGRFLFFLQHTKSCFITFMSFILLLPPILSQGLVDMMTQSLGSCSCFNSKILCIVGRCYFRNTDASSKMRALTSLTKRLLPLLKVCHRGLYLTVVL